MPLQGHLTPFARAFRIVSVSFACLAISSIVLVGCSKSSSRKRGIATPASVFALTDLMARPRTTSNLEAGPSTSGPSTSAADTSLGAINVETTNLTVILENLEVDTEGGSGPWMYTKGSSPFAEVENDANAVFANTKLSWNDDGRGNGSCSSGGSGRISRGYVDPYNFYLGLDNPPDLRTLTVELRNLSLSDFWHVNTVNHGGTWNTMGEAGDSRRYSHGIFKLVANGTTLLSTRNVQWVQNLSYPGPIGESTAGTFGVGGYFVAQIQSSGSDKEWTRRLDPHAVGYVLGILTAASFGPPNCVSSNSYWISLRGFPTLHSEASESSAGSLIADGDRDGAKVGIYKGSSDKQIATAQALSSLSKGLVFTAVGVAVGGAFSSAVSAALSPGLNSGPPGQGVARLLGTSAFIAKVKEIRGFHSDAMTEFGDGLRVFIGKVEWPWSTREPLARFASFGLGGLSRDEPTLIPSSSATTLHEVVRQDGESTGSVSDELFGGCAFYTTLIVVGFLLVHFSIWLATRRKPLVEQVAPHAWMIYLFSIVMSHVYTGAVLNSMQYMRSHVGNGTGKVGLYIVAVLQLLLIGLGFLFFFIAIMVLAAKRLRRNAVIWVPRQEMADPRMRRSAFIAGEYKGGDNTFHRLFECYYSSLAGPRVWIASIELSIVFLDAICTAVIWNEKVCLGVLVSVYAVLFATFLVLSPFVDKIEGTLVLLLGVVELLVLVMEFMGALGDYDTAEFMEFGALVLGFVAIGLAVFTAVYCDLIPILSSLWATIRRRFHREVVVDGQRSGPGSDMDSDWSGVSRSISASTQSLPQSEGSSSGIEHKALQVDALVAYNAEREKEVRTLLTGMFGTEVVGGRRRSDVNGTVDSSETDARQAAGADDELLQGEESLLPNGGREVEAKPQAKGNAEPT